MGLTRAAMHALLLILALCQAAPPAEMPVVEQSVEAISVAHLENATSQFHFWDNVQGETCLLDTRWDNGYMACVRDGDMWLLCWEDDGDGCYRVVRTRVWLESWEGANPLQERNNAPWFAQLLMAGLRQPGGAR